MLAFIRNFPLFLLDVLSGCCIQPGSSVGDSSSSLGGACPIFVSSAFNETKALRIAQIAEDETSQAWFAITVGIVCAQSLGSAAGAYIRSVVVCYPVLILCLVQIAFKPASPVAYSAP